MSFFFYFSPPPCAFDLITRACPNGGVPGHATAAIYIIALDHKKEKKKKGHKNPFFGAAARAGF